MNRLHPLLSSTLILMACAAAPTMVQATTPPADPPIVAFDVPAEPGIRATPWAEGLEHPWAMAWLPDGQALVSERPGRLRLISPTGKVGSPIAGVPEVAAIGQGGLLDIALHPDFARNRLIYFTALVGDAQANAVALFRARLDGQTLQGTTELLRNPRSKPQGQNLGSRLLWLGDGSLLMSFGDGGNRVQLDGALIREQSQNPASWFGKTLRLNADGKPAPGNPASRQRPGWDPHIWSLGNRNIQGLALDSVTGTVWATEHGARGGDELNRIEGGRNYGWPKVTYSREYSGAEITNVRKARGITPPVSVWTPSIGPSGLVVYRAKAMPALDGALLAGGLQSQDVRVIRMGADGTPRSERRIRVGARVRDVRVGPDGLIYVLTDEKSGRILRLQQARE